MTVNEIRPEMSDVKTLVLKVGSGVLVRDGVHLDRGTFCRLVEQITHLMEAGIQVALVSSGAVALGRGRMGVERPDRQSLPKLQALAAIGQTALMQLYDSEFAHYQRRCGQVLLTRDDLDDRTRYHNARRTLRAIWGLGALPIINENDTISTDEIRFGDNDHLAARVACLLEADLLVILSDVEGVFTADPSLNPDAKRIERVIASDQSLDGFVSDTKDQLEGVGTGGMVTKIGAARIAALRGIPTVIMSGKLPERLPELMTGASVGTYLVPASSRQSSRRSWVQSLKVRGRLHCDEGAAEALKRRGKSLLPSGLVEIEGRFDEGEAVEICTIEGTAFAKGLATYPAAALRRIKGVQSNQIGTILGYHTSDVVVHRDDMVFFSNGDGE